MMKTNSLFLVAALACCALSCSYAGEDTEYYGAVMPTETVREPQVKSGINADGVAVELLYRGDIKCGVLALLEQGGRRKYLYHRNPIGVYPAIPGVTTSILWITRDSFACVASGRMRSYYTLYCLDDDADATEDTAFAWKEAEGVFHYRVDWSVKDGRLIGYMRGDSCITISPISTLRPAN